MFLDLHRAVTSLDESDVASRARRAGAALAGVHVVAIGGFPVREAGGGRRTWCGSEVTVERVRAEILAGLGASAVLTRMNRSELSLDDLGTLCLQREHLWAFRWMTLSLLFAGYGLLAEIALARDGGLAMSWPVLAEPRGEVFVASGSLAAWGWVGSHADDRSFDEPARRALRDASEVVDRLLPEAWAD